MSICGAGDKECAICGLGGCCLTTMYEDNFELATKEQIVSRIDNNEYPFYKQLMIDTLKNVFDYIYEENQYVKEHQISTQECCCISNVEASNILNEIKANNEDDAKVTKRNKTC